MKYEKPVLYDVSEAAGWEVGHGATCTSIGPSAWNDCNAGGDASEDCTLGTVPGYTCYKGSGPPQGGDCYAGGADT